MSRSTPSAAGRSAGSPLPRVSTRRRTHPSGSAVGHRPVA